MGGGGEKEGKLAPGGGRKKVLPSGEISSLSRKNEAREGEQESERREKGGDKGRLPEERPAMKSQEGKRSQGKTTES